MSPLFLVAVGVGAFMFSHDFVAIGIAIPPIQDEFSSSLGTAQWAITGFSIAIAMAVVPAGRLADIHGAGATFAAGAFGFALTSAAIVVAPEMWLVLAGRVLQGVAAAFMWTVAIALIFAAFGPGRAGLAGAFLTGVGGLGTAFGPIDAGLLIEWLDWRAVFALNVPTCLFAAFVMLRHRSVLGTAAGRSIDWTGITLLSASLVILLITLRFAPEWGWGEARTIAGFVLTAALMGTFALQQRAWGVRAVVPPDISGNRTFMVTLIGEALLGASFYAVIAFAPQIFTNVLDAGSIGAGLMQVPTMLALTAGGTLIGFVSARISPAITVPAVGAAAALGGLVLALMPDDPSYLSLLPGLVLVGAGTGGVFSALITIGVGSLPVARGGLAGGLLYASQLAGGAVALGAATAVATEVASGAGDEPFAGLVQGIQSGFLLAVGIGALGIAATLLGYGIRARRSEPDEGEGTASSSPGGVQAD